MATEVAPSRAVSVIPRPRGEPSTRLLAALPPANAQHQHQQAHWILRISTLQEISCPSTSAFPHRLILHVVQRQHVRRQGGRRAMAIPVHGRPRIHTRRPDHCGHIQKDITAWADKSSGSPYPAATGCIQCHRSQRHLGPAVAWRGVIDSREKLVEASKLKRSCFRNLRSSSQAGSSSDSSRPSATQSRAPESSLQRPGGTTSSSRSPALGRTAL